jgi:hypothetical protein
VEEISRDERKKMNLQSGVRSSGSERTKKVAGK